MARVTLADLTDLEWLLRDPDPMSGSAGQRALRAAEKQQSARGESAAEFRSRIENSRRARFELLKAWLDLERAEQNLPGHRLERQSGVVGWILSLVAVLLGLGLASTALRYDGTEPVNVQWFLLLCVALPFLQLVFSLLVVFGILGRGLGLGSLAGQALRWSASRLGSDASGRSVDSVLFARSGLYSRFLRWRTFTTTQTLGLIYLLAALASLVLLGLVSDLRFCWATTLEASAEGMHGIVAVFGLPFEFVLPDWVPDLNTVRASQWDRLEGRYVVGELAESRRAIDSSVWWRFLIGCVLTLGVAPRLVALALGRWQLRRARSALRFDHAGFQAFFRKALPKVVGFAGPSGSSVRGPAPSQPEASALKRRKKSSAREASPASAVYIHYGRSFRDGDWPARLGRELSVSLQTIGHAGRDLDAEDAALDALRPASALVLGCEASSQPTKELLGFLRSARERVGDGRSITVVLATDEVPVGPAAEERLAIWRRSLSSLGDPHLELWTPGEDQTG